MDFDKVNIFIDNFDGDPEGLLIHRLFVSIGSGKNEGKDQRNEQKCHVKVIELHLTRQKQLVFSKKLLKRDVPMFNYEAMLYECDGVTANKIEAICYFKMAIENRSSSAM